MSMSECVDHTHFDFSHSCDICHGPLQKDEDDVVILYNRRFPTGAWKSARAVFRLSGVLYQGDRICLCPRGRGTRIPGCAIVHDYCFKLFSPNEPSKETLGHLGRYLTWSKIYLVRHGERQPPLFIPDQLGFSSAALEKAGDEVGIPLKMLPPEITIAIQGYSQDAPFWCLTRALALSFEYSAVLSDTKLITVPLTNVHSWKRGDASPRLGNKEEELPSVLRMTLDSRGVSQIERLSEHPLPLSSRNTSGTKQYIVADESRFARIKMHFQGGLSWLWCPTNHPGLQIWDTPTPPLAILVDKPGSPKKSKPGDPEEFTLDQCASSINSLSYFRFKTVDLSTATGLTFFYSEAGNVMFSIHVHTRNLPLAHLCRFHAKDRLDNIIYVPLPPGDEIEWLAVREGFDHRPYRYEGCPSFMLQTKLSGTVHVGLVKRRSVRTTAFSRDPKVLIRGGPDHQYRRLFSLFPKSDSDIPQEAYMPINVRGDLTTGRDYMFWSWAPLDNVKSAEVFHDDEGHFKGLLMAYNNGGQRAVGECRLGVDASKTWTKPSRLHVAKWNADGHFGAGHPVRGKFHLKIEFGDEPSAIEGRSEIPAIGRLARLNIEAEHYAHQWNLGASL
ncbi:hypothetical protein NM208_g11412 [Fusarium decemcellulare]|uniref:Uncharacterized protein n=1 Tax=Fusarium decemcellulare TaxID=57161 RepID=A0ACC1RSQ8_9HYPO|nr:hypothetical protein NM208_g11412 [Fusarium decemcellulare]